MASSSSLTPHSARDDHDSDSGSESPASAVLIFDSQVHNTVWDPRKKEVFTVFGRIVSEMIFPKQRLLSISLCLDHTVPSDGVREEKIVSLVKATLVGPSGGVKVAVPGRPYEPNWTISLHYFKLANLALSSDPEDQEMAHIIAFKVRIPVGSNFFLDKGSGDVTKSFNLRFEAITKHPTPESPSGMRVTKCGVEPFTVTVLKSWGAT